MERRGVASQSMATALHSIAWQSKGKAERCVAEHGEGNAQHGNAWQRLVLTTGRKEGGRG